MVSINYLKQVITPKDLALKTLGSPNHKQGKAFWYKSPFREEERTASFEVTDQSFHDFGTGEHFDIIGFMQRLNHCSFKEAVDTLSSMYNLTENEYDNERVRAYIEHQRLLKKAYEDEIEKWFYSFIDLIEDAWDENQACIEILQEYPETLATLYDRQAYLGCVREEILIVSSFQGKERLRNQVTKEGLPEWLKYQEKYFLISKT